MSEPVPSPDPIQVEPPHWSLWFVWLLFRPQAFFETFVVRSIPVLTVLTAWLYGMAGAMDRIETRAMMSERAASRYAFALDDWTMFWVVGALFGVLNGALYYGIGGWWYRKRLIWCGATDPDRYLARRVYVYSSMAWAVPYLVYTAWTTTVYASPARSLDGEDVWAFAVIIAIFWSIYVSYRGVRTVFDARRWPSRIWFGILPCGLYSISFAVIILALVFSGALEDEPDLEGAIRIERDAFSLEYPGNWAIDTEDEEYDPEANFMIQPEWADAVIRIWLYMEPMDSKDCVDQTREALEAEHELDRLRAIDSWGSHPGAGYVGEGRIEGERFELLMFCSTDRSQPFEVLQLVEEFYADKLRPGFERIRDSFTIIEPEPAVPGVSARSAAGCGTAPPRCRRGPRTVRTPARST